MGGTRNPVVVGLDGSTASWGALRWAVRHAALRGLPLRVLHAAGSAGPEAWAAGRSMIAEAVAEARALRPGLTVTGDVIDGQPVTELCAASETAEVVAVAGRGVGGFPGLRLGSVSAHLAAQARGTVAVVHNPEVWLNLTPAAESDLPVLVGSDSSPESERAIAVGFEEAALRGVPLVAIRAWQPPLIAHRGEIRQLHVDRAASDRSAQYAVREAVAAGRAKYPEVKVDTRVVSAGPAAAIVTASDDAQLVVVGSRGHSRITGPRLGTTADQLLRHVQCPIMIVRSGGDQPPAAE